ncbi:MAG TPA: hypothetical protein VFH85_07755 [Gammaproteobacteria bacterium]|nr:hypothetical protein [Gammaproteobacteria bacterium]
MKQEKHALYLMPLKDGQYGPAELVPADEVDDKLEAGYVQPVGLKANGAAWNAEGDLPGQDAAAKLARTAKKAVEPPKADKKK